MSCAIQKKLTVELDRITRDNEELSKRVTECESNCALEVANLNKKMEGMFSLMFLGLVAPFQFN
jgi:predicted transcriptional regulator with HTH domain